MQRSPAVPMPAVNAKIMASRTVTGFAHAVQRGIIMKHFHTTIRTAAALMASVALVAGLTACGSDVADTSSVAADCKPAHEFSTITQGKLTIAIPELPPFSSYQDGKATGIDPQIIEKIAAKECLTPEYMQTSFAESIPAVQSGRADVAVGDYYRTKERAAVVGMSDAMYADQLGIVSKSGTSSLKSLEGQNIGTVDGYLWLDDAKAIWGDKLTIYPSNVEMVQDIESGRIMAGLDSYATAANYSKGKDYTSKVADKDDRVGASIDGVQAGIPYTKGNAALGTALNEDLKALRDDGSLAAVFSGLGLDTSATEITSKPIE